MTTEACNACLAAGGGKPKGLWEQEQAALKAIEEAVSKKFGDPKSPLLASCRSGAKFSMPGVMDTVLNSGLNDEIAVGLVELTGDERFVFDCYRRLVQMFGSVVMGIPDEMFEDVIADARSKANVNTDAELTADVWRAVTQEFKIIFRRRTHRNFPDDPYQQLNLAVEAVCHD